MKIAVTREISSSINECELTHIARAPIDLERARAQHRAYEQALEAAGCEIVRVEPAHDLPDAVFVEDAAVVVDELAVITRPGAASRRAETAGIAAVLGRYRALKHIDAPGTVDGGDVVVAGRRVFAGRSSRTNDAGIARLRAILTPFGYDVRGVDVRGCLHLKSAATSLSDGRLLVNPAWIDRRAFDGTELVDIDPSEPYAANIVSTGGRLIYPAAFPKTRHLLERRGFRPGLVDLSELAKAEGAVTCCSLVFRA